MENLSSLNINKICRVCLVESDQMYSIYSELYEDQADLTLDNIPCIYEILISISSIKVQADDGLPSMMCTKCIDMAHTSFKFQKQCNQSQIILDAYLKQCPIIKEENGEGSDDLTELEQINKNDLVQSNGGSEIDPNDFLLEEEILTIKDEACIGKSDNRSIGIEELTDDIIENVESDSTGDNTEIAQETSSQNEISNKVYTCNICKKTYKHSNSLRVHMRNHTEEKPYECKTCGKSFTQYGSLLYHQRGHTGEQPYACKLCGKKYRQSGTLTAHMRIHTGQRPFLCSICGRGFRQAPDLGYHMRFHTKEKPYMCNVCGKTMSMQSHLVQHMRIHTGERPYKCSVCEKAFPSSTRLKRHAIIHTSLKPYTCEVCSKSFNRMSSLKVHAKIHTDERSHVCPICGKGFIQAHALRSHLVSHSSELTIKRMQSVV